jgi:superfamily II DNA/RNA helicase
MPRPDLLDNLKDDSRHSAALAYLVEDIPAKHPLSVATGYVNLAGLDFIASVVKDGRGTRLLLGAMPEQGLDAGRPAGRFEVQLAMLGKARDLSRFPPSRAAERLAVVDAWLERNEVEVRRFVTRFLHGKAYLFGAEGDGRAALVTSANLTAGGLHANLELGLVDYNKPQCDAALSWFNGVWDQAEPFKDELRGLLFPDPGLIDADTVYLRALLELYGAEDEAKPQPPLAEVRLADFQRDGYERARRILERHHGVIYADGVGTGKTEIGLALIEQYALREGHYALVVAPAQLAKMWAERVDQARLPAQVVSYQAFASDEQLAPRAAHPGRHLHNGKDAYRLIVVDEAHALRNEDTTWYRAMERLLGGPRKDAVLLTATPVNNGLWDLYNLVMLFARHDRALAADGIGSIRELFVRAGANERDPENLDPDVLFPVADAVSVRRDRPFIEEHYPDATFPDGTPVRFPRPVPETRRYDLDSAHPGFFDAITDQIDALTMARYTPTSYLVEEAEERSVEVQLGGLLKSSVLKRFESCWAACKSTVERLIAAHDAFLLAWDEAEMVPSSAALKDAARLEFDESGLASAVAEQLEGDPEALPRDAFQPEYREAVQADRERLAAVLALLEGFDSASDPKLDLLAELLASSPAEKVAVFTTYGDTVKYLDEHLPERIGGRERVAVVGSETNPDQRTQQLARFSPRTVVREDYRPPEGEVDLLVSTDILSEGQNLQQAQAVISYDMPWNPQRVVQRNGRVIRLLSPHDRVYLTTMLPEPGELEELLALEARVRAKIRAASLFGMEVEVIEGLERELGDELRNYAERLGAADESLLVEEEDELSGAFLGELLRAFVDRATAEGERQRVERLPWGIGAAFRRNPESRSKGAPGIFFATRTTPMAGAEDGYRYWRYVEATGEVIDSELEMLRRIDPGGSEEADAAELDLEAAWQLAASSIVEDHNARATAPPERIGPAQRFALDILRDPAVVLPEGAARAAEALAVQRGAAVRRALNEVKAELEQERVSRDEAAKRVVGVVETYGLQPVPVEPRPAKVDVDDLGVVCWMGVLDG